MTKTIDTPELYKKATKEYLYDDLKNKAHAMIDSERKLIEFSIFKDMGGFGDTWKVKAPNIESTKPVIEGNVIFYSDYWRLTAYNKDEKVFTTVFTNPTWKDIINSVNNMLLRTCNYGLYLEGLSEDSKKVEGCKMVRIEFGS